MVAGWQGFRGRGSETGQGFRGRGSEAGVRRQGFGGRGLEAGAVCSGEREVYKSTTESVAAIALSSRSRMHCQLVSGLSKLVNVIVEQGHTWVMQELDALLCLVAVFVGVLPIFLLR